jgi:AraC-like DNA-binding protein
MLQRYVSPTLGLIIEDAGLRLPELVVRATVFRHVIVDERLLSPAFPLLSAPTRLTAVVMLDGTLELFDRGGCLRVGAGESVLLGTLGTQRARWDCAAFVDLEWTSADAAAHATPTKLGRPDLARVRALAAALVDQEADHRDTWALALRLFRSIGAPVRVSRGAFSGEPSERDRRLARALGDQLGQVASRATTVHLADLAGLSPRQIQRVIQDFNTRYALNAGNWRDMRNRLRVQLAAVLLSVQALSVAGIAAEVGYGSPNALARAFAKAGFASPAEFRRALRSES